MKYALVLASDLNKRDWVCYLIADSTAAIKNLNCYNPTVVKLPKSSYPGTVDPSPVFKQSCVTGNNAEFRIVSLQNLNLTGAFNLA